MGIAGYVVKSMEPVSNEYAWLCEYAWSVGACLYSLGKRRRHSIVQHVRFGSKQTIIPLTLRSVFGTNNRIMTFYFPSEYSGLHKVDIMKVESNVYAWICVSEHEGGGFISISKGHSSWKWYTFLVTFSQNTDLFSCFRMGNTWKFWNFEKKRPESRDTFCRKSDPCLGISCEKVTR